MEILLIIAAVSWAIMICLGAYISGQKGRSEAEGVFLAILLGPLGLLIAALLPSASRSPSNVATGPSPEAMDRFYAKIAAEKAADQRRADEWMRERIQRKARRREQSLSAYISKGIRPGPFAMFELASVMILDWFRGLSELGQLGVICVGVASAVGAVAIVAFRSMSH